LYILSCPAITSENIFFIYKKFSILWFGVPGNLNNPPQQWQWGSRGRVYRQERTTRGRCGHREPETSRLCLQMQRHYICMDITLGHAEGT